MTATSAVNPLRDLADIKKLQAVLQGGLQRLQDYAAQLQITDAYQIAAEALTHLQNDSFTVAVVGEFKRGKSTFINALLGSDVLPTDVLPTTATLNRIVYGMRPSVTVAFKDGHAEDIEFTALGDYVTKLTDEAADRAAGIAEAVVRCPVPFLLNNVEIIDTPGLNDEASMDVITNSIVPHVDAAILVITPQAPFSQYEADFVEHRLMESDLGRIVFVLTRLDSLATIAEQDRMIAFVTARVREKVLERAAAAYGADSEEYRTHLRKIGVPRVFGVAALPALQAKLTNNATALAASRFPELEAALLRFLSEERGPILLQVPLNRVRTVARLVLTAIAAREESLLRGQDQLAAPYESARSTQEALRREVDATIAQFTALATGITARLASLPTDLQLRLTQAAVTAVDTVPIMPTTRLDQLRGPATNALVAQALVRPVAEAGRRWLTEVCALIRAQLVAEATRLRDLAQRVTPALGEATGPLADPAFPTEGRLEAVLAALVSTIVGPAGGALARIAPDPGTRPPAAPGADLVSCIHCGRANPPPHKFCRGCGQLMSVLSALPCPRCGRANPPTHKFCTGCGQPVPGLGLRATPPSPGPQLGGRASTPPSGGQLNALLGQMPQHLSSFSSDIKRHAGEQVVRGYRELKKREFRDTISQAFAGSGVVAAVQHEITAACLMLQRTFTDHILAALDNNLALLAEQHARSATRIDIELQRLVLMRATSEGLEQQARQWLAQLAALADAQPTDDSRRTAHESRETRDDNI